MFTASSQKTGLSSDGETLNISQALCLPVSVREVIDSQSRILELEDKSDYVTYFLVDCRPAEQYNAGHLPTAFHLDCNLVSWPNHLFKIFH